MRNMQAKCLYYCLSALYLFNIIFGVVKEVVEYGRSLEEKHNKHFRFTLTTNGVLLNDEIMEFANKEMDNVVLSVDGRKEIHDYMRPTRNGKPSYDLIMPKFIRFAESRHHQKSVEGLFPELRTALLAVQQLVPWKSVQILSLQDEEHLWKNQDFYW